MGPLDVWKVDDDDEDVAKLFDWVGLGAPAPLDLDEVEDDDEEEKEEEDVVDK